MSTAPLRNIELRTTSPSNNNNNTTITTTSNDNENNDPGLTSTPIDNDGPVTTLPIASNNNNITSSETPNNNNNATTSSTKPTTSSSSGKRSRSSSAKTDSYEMTPDMKEEYKRAFEALDDDKKWCLADGTRVEDVIYAYGAKCDYEQIILSSLAHSFILDTGDKCWESVFTSSQLKEIKSTDKKALCEYDESIKNMFSELTNVIKDAYNRKLLSSSTATTTTTAISTTTTEEEEQDLLDELWERITKSGYINPCKAYDLYWLQNTMVDILHLYRFRVLEWVSKNGSEMDFVNRVWSMLDKVFDGIMIETRRDNGSVATTFIDNQERSVTGMTAIAAKSPSIRPDLVLYKNGVEYRVAECGKGDNEGTGKKEIVETNLHCPKVMKSMLLHAASKCDNDKGVTRALRIIGFTHFDLRMKVLVMDNPNGYVCRIRSTPQYEISTIPSHMSSGLFPILKLTLKSKLTVQSSIKTVHDYLILEKNNEPDVEYIMDENRERLVLPRLQKSPNKKLKTSV
ncbi:hypothetical protein INT45_004488 [Circinella minor]|uniref:Uncharacterized protein n=1 Tax=Circinella minor TaxID=1195481 RepID=A0A8H7S300_9FUNG|nr:hypothetical protein INT45_004488 [Circinella minor]